MKHISGGNCSESLINALEQVEEMEHVIILYQNKENSSHVSGFFTDGDQTLETSNWLVDRFKAYLLRHLCPCDNCGN